MFGILIYLYFLLIGYAYCCLIFKDKDIYFRIWTGGIFGNVLLMAGIVLPSLLLGFTLLCHLVLIVISAVPLFFLAKKHILFAKQLTVKSGDDSGVNTKILLCVILPISLLISLIMTNHVLVPCETGGVASGQSTYGDLQMHLGFITSIAEQKVFPPDYAFLDGYTLNYPFFVNMLSSSMYLFGTSLRLSVLIPGYVLSTLLVFGFYIISYRLTKKKSSAVLAVILFFFGAGFGFSYFLDGAKADSTVFTSIFNDYYQTPTNLNEHNMRWSNPICDMIIPQRTTMAGWCIFFAALWLLLEAIDTKSRKYYIILGILAGCMPMIHTHSFLALGMISAVLFFSYLISEKDKKNFIINWVIFGATALFLAVPQLFFWTFSQTAGNDAFLRFSFNWVNESDPYLWFYLKNWGIIALFAVPAIIHASKDNKKLLLACAFIFCTAELIVFQPNEYDNNKLIFISYMILLIVVSDWLVYMFAALSGIKCRGYLAALIIISGTLSGTLTIIREYKSGADFLIYSDEDLKMAEYIKENTEPDSVFLTGTQHLNPVVSLAGRNIYAGSSLYVHYHGLGDEFRKREAEINTAYQGTYEELIAFCKLKGIDYIYISDYEKANHSPSDSVLNNLEAIFSSGTSALYKVSTP